MAQSDGGTRSDGGVVAAAGRPGRGLKSAKVLHTQLADSLRDRLHRGEWLAGDRLPTEAQLSAEYGVSRSTVRAALQSLESQRRTVTRHGIGTFVTRFGGEISIGLQELRSMSEMIRANGMEPQMSYHSAVLRPATAEEIEQLRGTGGDRVFATQRAVLADGEVVAYSYDAIPQSLLPDGFDPASAQGSLFELLASFDRRPATSIAEIHAAAAGVDVGWGDRDPAAVYVRLDQQHFTTDGSPVLASCTYFREGRFRFSVLRTR